MRNIKLTLEYDGSAFYGFQLQPRHETVQGALEKALSKFLGKKTKIAAASGRTDTGVHASCQVVNFRTEKPRTLRQIQHGLNMYLPDSIAVTQVEEVSKDFHARFSATRKTYEYRIWNDDARSPLQAAQSYHFPYALNVNKMRAAAALLSGKHDFGAFVSVGEKAEKGAQKIKNTTRTIESFEVKRQGKMIMICVTADGFLYRMVRNLVGALLEIGKGKMTLKDLKEVLNSKDRRKAPSPVPAQGLKLLSVTY